MSPLGPEIGIIIIDHGSKRAEANDMLLEVVRAFRAAADGAIVEPAHMELAEPTLAQAFARCVAQGVKRIVIHPYFLAPGRHSTTDIPALASEAARPYPGVPYTVSRPLGLDSRMTNIIRARVEEALDP